MFRRLDLQRDARSVYGIVTRISYSDVEPDLGTTLQNGRRLKKNIEIRVVQLLPRNHRQPQQPQARNQNFHEFIVAPALPLACMDTRVPLPSRPNFKKKVIDNRPLVGILSSH